ncbi:MAG: LptF/LptG family permease [Rickettsiales bacterium]|nr:LptF/LptG family permease [Rickettsiales bacterium]
MRRIDLYLAQRILVMMLFVGSILLLALSLERLLRLVDEVTTSGAPIGQAVLMLSYLQPHYLGLTIPAALFLGVMLTIRRLHEQSEWVIFHAGGFSLWRLTRPILLIGLMFAVLHFLLVSLAQPYSRYAFRAAYHQIHQTQQQVLLRPHAFLRLNNRLVIRIEEVETTEPLVIKGFFSATSEKDGSRTLLSADRARVSNEPHQPFTLLLSNGSIVTETKAGRVSAIAFNSYTWSPTLDPIGLYGVRGQDKRELTLFELLSTGLAGGLSKATPAERRAELHLRLVQVASVPVLALLAIPLGLIGGNRSGRAYGLGVGLVSLILYEKILGFAQALVSSGKASPFLTLWGVWGLMLSVVLLLLAYRNELPASAYWLSRQKRAVL